MAYRKKQSFSPEGLDGCCDYGNACGDASAFNDTISRKRRNGRLTAGAVVVFHPFSKSMGFNPHLYILVIEGGFDRHDNFIRQKLIPYGVLRKTWQYQVLTRFKAALPKEAVYSALINRIFQEYPRGFYVHLPK